MSDPFDIDRIRESIEARKRGENEADRFRRSVLHSRRTREVRIVMRYVWAMNFLCLLLGLCIGYMIWS